jgi:streptogramin lyase
LECLIYCLDGNYVFIADYGNRAIRKLDVITGNVTTLAVHDTMSPDTIIQDATTGGYFVSFPDHNVYVNIDCIL